MTAADYYAMKRAGKAAQPTQAGDLTTFPEIEQGTEEWFDQRRGLVTASVVGKLLTVSAPGAMEYACTTCGAEVGAPCVSLTRKEPTPIKTFHDWRAQEATAKAKTAPPIIEVADNDTSQGVTFTLIAERIAAFTEDTPMSSDMWRGVEHEPYARDVYAENYGAVEVVGFMLRDFGTWRLGYSPDGLVGDDGLIEVKCPRAKTHLRTILADEVPAHHMAQLQAGLLVSGRKWIDFVSFVAGMPLFRKRVTPDPIWFDAITAACVAFERTAAQTVADYRERVADMPQTERLDFEIKVA